MGLAGFALVALLGFEEPNDTLLLLSSGFSVAPVVALFVHLTLTRALTPAQRRIWLRQLTSRRAPWAFGEYVSCADLGSVASRIGQDGPPEPPSSQQTNI